MSLKSETKEIATISSVYERWFSENKNLNVKQAEQDKVIIWQLINIIYIIIDKIYLAIDY